MLKIHNTMTGKKELFVPLQHDHVRMYVCGITPYDVAHVGHGRVYVTFDMLYRLLRFLGYNVRYCRNFTDIDDKLLHKAEKEFGDKQRYPEIADRYIDAYHRDMKLLGCLAPSYEPRVTATMPTIINFIEGLVQKGIAYVVDGDVYFSIASFPAYGALSKHKIEDLRAGTRVEVNEKKRDPLDFALWKGEAPGSFWQSPWGYGRPGWHIECSALAAHYLGQQLDIHAGGLDLIFPHHENEIAQSEGLFSIPFSRYWMHNGFVRINQEKMSKSLGNFFSLQDVFAQFDPMIVRFYILSHHYKAPLEFSFDDMSALQKSYRRLCRAFEGVQTVQPNMVSMMDIPIIQELFAFLVDDLNTPGMWGVIFERLGSLASHPAGLVAVKSFLTGILGLTLIPIPEKQVEMSPEIERLLQEREQARVAQDWATSDSLRARLQELGYTVQDKKALK
jgi:cysteinyl-tRNA synthetase